MENLYTAAAEPASWSGLAPQFAGFFRSGSCVVRLVNRRSLAFNLASVTPNLTARAALYEQYFQYRDPWAAFLRTHPNQSVSDGEILPERDWERSEVYNDHAGKLGIYRLLGIGIEIDRDTLGVIAVHRERNAAGFDSADRRIFDRFVPHFRRAMRMRQELGTVRLQHDASLAALERLDAAVLVVEESGRILFNNALAMGRIAKTPALCIKSDRLRATAPEAEPLFKAIRDACSAVGMKAASPASAVLLRQNEGAYISALTCPLPSHGRAALVILREGCGREAALSGLLTGALGLTPSEAEIASALSDGDTLERIAASRRTSIHTVRNQLKSIMAKTGTSRQTELLVLLSRTVGAKPDA